MKSVFVVFGTRPEAIKMCPVIEKLRDSKEFVCKVILTGQHREMLDQMLNVFSIKADYDLNLMKEKQTLQDITIGTIIGVSNIIKKEKPNLLMVHGDTTTSYAGALAAFYEKTPVAHIEAGLRTYNMHEPFPEVVRHVVRPHREVRGHRGEQRTHHRRRHHAAPAARDEREHRRIGEIAFHERRVDVREFRLQGGEVGENDQRGERREVPGPGTDRVIHDLVEDRAADAVVLAFRGQHPLHDVSAAARLRTGIPDVPPLDCHRDDEDGYKCIGVRKIREERQARTHVRTAHQIDKECAVFPHLTAECLRIAVIRCRDALVKFNYFHDPFPCLSGLSLRHPSATRSTHRIPRLSLQRAG